MKYFLFICLFLIHLMLSQCYTKNPSDKLTKNNVLADQSEEKLSINKDNQYIVNSEFYFYKHYLGTIDANIEIAISLNNIDSNLFDLHIICF